MEDGVKKFACRYAVVQFVPYSETGEFVNAGVVLACPQTAYFGFRLQIKKQARVNAFFKELAPKVYPAAIGVIKTEMERVRDILLAQPAGADEMVRTAFTSLVHPREAIIRFCPARALLTDDPETELEQLFDKYVNRSFATPEYAEKEMGKRLRALLKDLDLQVPFRAARIGDSDVHAQFPLVQRTSTELLKVIKPFHLNQPQPNDIFDHGDAWVQKIRRLRAKNLLPDDVLFAVAGPPVTDVNRYAAFRDICIGLEKNGVQIIEEAAKDSIVEFAAA